MSSTQPKIASATGHRTFDTHPVAVQAIIINKLEEILLLSSPTRNSDGAWQPVSGALEAGETVLDGTLREVGEELGSDIQVHPLGSVHVQSFHYDDKVRFMVATYYLFQYKGGAIMPSDDMVGSDYRWWSLTDLEEESVIVHIPPDGKWLYRRAVNLYRQWKNDRPNLQMELS